MLNIVRNEDRLNYQRNLIRDSIILERQNVKQIIPILGRCYLDSARLLELGILDIDHVIKTQTKRLQKVFLINYKRTANYFSNKFYDFLDKRKNIMKVPMIKTMKDEFWREMVLWISSETAKKITMINKTTRDVIKKVIEKGTMSGKSYREIAKDLRKIKGITNPRRAMVIARTETHTALVKSMDVAAKSTKIEMEREWCAVLDERTRGSNAKDKWNHIIADKEVVGQDEPFLATGEPLEFPGDPSGSPGNVISCRCVVLYHTKDNIIEGNPEIQFESVIEGE